MLETLREFGIEELNAHGEVDAVRERHLHGLIDRLGNPGPRDWIRPQLSYQELLPGDQNNLRAALDWALDHAQVEQAVQIAYGLRISWFLHGLNVEADETM